jgi:hypothetical protein
VLQYKPRAVLNAGFASAAVTSEAIESGDIERLGPRRDGPALVAFFRVIGVKAGDVQRVVVTGPAGEVVADVTQPPLDRDKAQLVVFVGKKAPAASAWPAGSYEANYTVTRGGSAVLEHRSSVVLD